MSSNGTMVLSLGAFVIAGAGAYFTVSAVAVLKISPCQARNKLKNLHKLL